MRRFRTANPPEFLEKGELDQRASGGGLSRQTPGWRGRARRSRPGMPVHERDTRASYPIRVMPCALRVSASGYYAWRSRPPSARATAGGDLLRRIRRIHAASNGTYGAPRVLGEWQAEGVAISTRRGAKPTSGSLGLCKPLGSLESAAQEASARPAPTRPTGRRRISCRRTSSSKRRTNSRWPSPCVVIASLQRCRKQGALSG